ncbi:MAG: YjbF family lipoprotein [Gammaproteobacteria bacterium]|nr:YjbF family lipoprotein [Gammaproteobacteria bacterium]
MISALLKPTALVLSLGLAGCGSDNQTPALSDHLLSAAKTLTAKKGAPDPGRAAAARLTRAQVETSTRPLIRLSLEEDGTVATAAKAAENRSTASYFMATGQAVYLKDGLLTGTRGLGNDLMSLDVSPATLPAALSAGHSARTYRYLDPEGQIYPLNITCTLSAGPARTLIQVGRSYGVTPVSETCQGGGESFTNLYQINLGSGQIWQSVQWVGPIVGRMKIEILTP